MLLKQCFKGDKGWSYKRTTGMKQQSFKKIPVFSYTINQSQCWNKNRLSLALVIQKKEGNVIEVTMSTKTLQIYLKQKFSPCTINRLILDGFIHAFVSNILDINDFQNYHSRTEPSPKPHTHISHPLLDFST